jgi:hypothetical protein
MKVASNRNVPRRGVLWFGTITLGAITGFMALFFSQSSWSTAAMAFVAICTAATFGLLLTLINAARFWWGMRLVTLIMFATVFWSLISAAFSRHELHGPDEMSSLDAIRAFLFFGLPSLLYTLWGSTWGKLGRDSPAYPTRADVVVLRMAIIGRWVFLALTLVVAFAAYLRMEHYVIPR